MGVHAFHYERSYWPRQAENEGRSAYLISTDERNEGFYKEAGFVVVEQWTLGENNPRWKQKPVVVSIVS